MQSRLEELRRLGVQAVEFSGKSSAFTLSVLGKGYVGVVAIAHVDSEKYALKMQRVDSDRESWSAKPNCSPKLTASELDQN